MNEGDLPSDIQDLLLDAGEKQTLYIAQREKADLVLFDDEKVREEGKARGLTGTCPASPAMQAGSRAQYKSKYLTGKPRPVGGELHY